MGKLAFVAVLAMAVALSLATASAVAADVNICTAGSDAGQCENAQGTHSQNLAVDTETGRLYVADRGNNRVDVFGPGPGHAFAFAFGWGVAVDGDLELQSCGPQAAPPTGSCFRGLTAGGAGAFNAITDIAVDNDSTSLSQHDIYVLGDHRVQKFDDEGNFLLTWGGGVISGGASGSGNLTSGSNQIGSVQTTAKRFAVGQTIAGVGIPPGTKIASMGPGTITLSKAATTSGAGVALSVAEGAGNQPVNEIQEWAITDPNQNFPTGNLCFNTPDPSPTQDCIPVNLVTPPPASGPGSLQEGLEGMDNIGSGNVSVTGPTGGPYIIEFKGARFADTDVEEVSYCCDGLAATSTVQHGGGAPEICTAAIVESCSAGIEGSEVGQFFESAHLAVGPGGMVHVVDCVGSPSQADCENRLQKFDPSGIPIGELALPQSGLAPRGVAVNSGGEVYVSDEQALRKYSPAGNLLKALPEASGVTALSIDAADHLFAAELDSAGPVKTDPVIAEYDAADNTVRRFGYGVIKSRPSGLAHFPTAGDEIYSAEGSSVIYREFPPPGPILAPRPCKAGPIGNIHATLGAEINPEGKETKFWFEYVTEEQFQADQPEGFANASKTPEATMAQDDFLLHNAALKAQGLEPETEYRCRAVAKNADGETPPGPEGKFETKEPFEFGSAWTTDVGEEEATVFAEGNPLGAPTKGQIEYVEDAKYQVGKFAEAQSSPVAGIDFDASEEMQLRSITLTGLESGTLYHYRLRVNGTPPEGIVCPEAESECPEFEHTFRTYLPEVSESDQRGYELVSPGEKNSADVAVPGNAAGFLEPRFVRIVAGATSGEAMTYTSWTSFGGAEGAQGSSQYFSKRGGSGWATQNISPKGFIWSPLMPPYVGFSADLSYSAFKTTEPALTENCRQSIETLYLRDIDTGELHCLMPDVPDAPEPCPVFAGVSADGSRAFLAGKPESGASLTYSLYGWTKADGEVQLVSVFPGPQPNPPNPPPNPNYEPESGVAAPATAGTSFGAAGNRDFGSENCDVTRRIVRHAVSEDGSKAFWTYSPEPALSVTPEAPGVRTLAIEGVGDGKFTLTFQAQSTSQIAYDAQASTIQNALASLGTIGAGNVEVTGTNPFTITFKGPLEDSESPLSVQGIDLEAGRTMLFARLNGTETVQLDRKESGIGANNSGDGVFWGASADGSVAYFTAPRRLVSGGANPQPGAPDLYRYQFGQAKPLTDITKGSVPGDVQGVVGISDDGSYIYFVAGAVLTSDPNQAGQKAVTGGNNLYLYHEGETDFIATLAPEDNGVWQANPRELRARVSPDGRHLAFLSVEAKKLVGYDPTIAAGEHCQYQLNLDDVVELVGSPLCPQAFLYEADSADLSCASCNPSGSRPLGPTVVPGWSNGFEGPRFLSDDGTRLFFQSFDELLQADENGLSDVYEFERPGKGSCSGQNNNFDPASGGCHFLISSGDSGDENYLLDASATGRDVFFSTRQKLVGWDVNENFDVYDFREGGGFPEPPEPPHPCTAGESCKPPALPGPPPTAPPATSTFTGPGNPLKQKPCKKGFVRKGKKCVKKKTGKGKQRHRGKSQQKSRSADQGAGR